MKRGVGIALVLLLIVGCDESTGTTKAEIDSTMQKIDSSFERASDKAEAAFDSTKVKVKELGKDIDSAFSKDIKK